MIDSPPPTLEKALTINLDPLKYGTIAEIGAGQEVARWFFQAGAAAGTIAKSMSAYDMNFSDQIYGRSPDGRYVSRARLSAMLDQEFKLVVERLRDHRPETSTFFAFANTVSALGFKKKGECHGWLGIRFQNSPGAKPNEIILHVRLLDDSNLEQQEALGVLGVNLIYGAYFYSDKPKKLLNSLMDNLRWGRTEIDLAEMSGPELGQVDNKIMALELVSGSLTRAIMFNPQEKLVIPADVLYRHGIIMKRLSLEDNFQETLRTIKAAKGSFVKSYPDLRNTILIGEITLSRANEDRSLDTTALFSRISELCGAGVHVLVSEFFRYFRVRQYFARYTSEPVALATNISELEEVFREEYYKGIPGGVMEGLGQLFSKQTTAYVFPKPFSGQSVELANVQISAHLRPLLDYLVKRGHISLGDG
ncbi:MAG: hypothetical protein VW226_09050 [Rhodospirillaceae bacterium]